MRSLAVFLPILALYVLLFRRFDIVCDDAYISYQYAKHLAAGQGLRFNLGTEPVQGYTNFLWVLWNSLLIRLGIDPGLGSRLTSFACGFHLLLSVMRRAAVRTGNDRAAPLAAGFLLAGLAPFAAWSSSGLETVPVTWALFHAFDRLAGEERPRPAGAAFFGIIAGLLRTDALVHLAGIATGAWLATPPDRRRPLVRAVVSSGAVLLGTLAVCHVWQFAYFGDWMPQTVRAKVTGSSVAYEQGMKYVATLLVTFPALGLALLLPGGALPRVTSLARATAVLAVWGYAYAAIAGGDWMAFGRLVVPVLPFLALSFGLRAAGPDAPGRGQPLRLVAVGIVILSALPGAFDRPRVPESILRALHFRWNTPDITSELEFWERVKRNADENLVLGRALALHARPGDSIVLGAIGAVAWSTDLFVFDRNGLVSPEVTERAEPTQRRSPGHLRNVPPSFFLESEPTILQATVVDSSYGLKAIPPPGPAILRDYERVTLPLREEDGFAPGSVLALLRRRERRTALDEAPAGDGRPIDAGVRPGGRLRATLHGVGG